MTFEQAVAAAMRRCRNYFADRWKEGTFTIEGGALVQAPPNVDWLYIQGSFMNDGVYHSTERRVDMRDEEFTGRVYYLNPPPDFLAICQQIADYSVKNTQATPISESFGDYSHKRPTGDNGGVLSWAKAFERDLAPYVRMYSDV